MSAAAIPRLLSAAPARAVVPVLALHEARRLLRHPFTLVGFAVYVIASGSTVVADQGPRSAFETVSMIQSFYPGTLLILAGTMLVTRDHRAGSLEVLGPLPGRAEERVKAMTLAALAPALVGLVLTVVLHVLYLALDRYSSADGAVPGVWHILGGPVSLVGASMFGIVLGVWAPSRVTAVLGLVAMIVANVWLGGQGDLQLLSASLGWAEWGQYPEQWAGVVAGSPALHVGYLLSLCGMGAAAAWVRVADRRTAPVVLGLTALATAVLTGVGQLP